MGESTYMFWDYNPWFSDDNETYFEKFLKCEMPDYII